LAIRTVGRWASGAVSPVDLQALDRASNLELLAAGDVALAALLGLHGDKRVHELQVRQACAFG
jgi:hypothetical protein